MLDNLKENEQLIFTTHNTGYAGSQSSEAFLCVSQKKRRQMMNTMLRLCMPRIFLKRNTDSIRCAVENDVFSSLPDDSLLDMLEKGVVG